MKKSRIHGEGIFSNGFIPKGELVMEIRGEVIDGDECMRREDEEDNVYIFWNGDDCFIDTNHSGKIRFINHDCDPNCEVMDGDEEHLKLVAIKDILPNDEIVIDYDYEEIYEDCSCRTCLNKNLEHKAS